MCGVALKRSCCKAPALQQLFPAIWRKENGYDSEPAPLLLLLASLGGSPALGLLGCVLCGFSVGIMWPGTISITSGTIPMGGTAMFALLARPVTWAAPSAPMWWAWSPRAPGTI